LFGPLMQHLRRRRFHRNEEVETALREWLRMQKPHMQRDGVLNLVPRSDKGIDVLNDIVKK
jgi:hypothetical protein